MPNPQKNSTKKYFSQNSQKKSMKEYVLPNPKKRYDTFKEYQVGTLSMIPRKKCTLTKTTVAPQLPNV